MFLGNIEPGPHERIQGHWVWEGGERVQSLGDNPMFVGLVVPKTGYVQVTLLRWFKGLAWGYFHSTPPFDAGEERNF